MPEADAGQIESAVERELSIEKRHCFAFPPIVQLIREAKSLGLRIMIVSDTYLSAVQLGQLIEHAGGLEIFALIDHVFTSSDHGCGKQQELFPIILKKLGALPKTILHFGDNRASDCDRPSTLGMHVVHLVQFDTIAEQRLRLEATSAIMLDASVRISRPVHQPHRALVAMRAEQEPAFVLGHDVIGPILHAFALWIKQEKDNFEARLGRVVHPLFMMRDGYLPMRIFEMLFPASGARPVEITRLVAARAGLCTEQAILAFLDSRAGAMPSEALAKHLSLSMIELADLCKPLNLEECDATSLAEALAKPRAFRKIMKKSEGFGRRLEEHMRTLGIKRDDAIMLVDLGYNGTAQNLLEPYLVDQLGMTVAGRYLLLREVELRKRDKRGFIDTRNYEHRSLHSLSICVAVLEQICNLSVGSTVDLDKDGTPIREATDKKSRQSEVRDRIQAGAAAYVAAITADTISSLPRVDQGASRTMSIAALGRLFLLPMENEVELLETFEQDINLGSGSSLKMLDRQAAVTGLRSIGLPYINSAERFFIPGEIQRHGLPLNISFFSSLRFSLDLRDSDFSVGGVDIPVVLADTASQTPLKLKAYPTADGFYRLAVPIGVGRFIAAVGFGLCYEWVQIENVMFQSVANFVANDLTSAKTAEFMVENMTSRAPGLYEMRLDGSLIAPPPRSAWEPLVMIVVFRPITPRQQATSKQVAQAA